MSIRSTSSPMPHLAGALRGNVDIRFEILVLVHRGQHVGWRVDGSDVVAHMHRNVAHHAVERRADGVVGQQLLLRLARLHRRLVIRLGVVERPAAPARRRRGWSRPPQTACAAARPRLCCSRRAPSSAVPWRAPNPPWPVAAADRSPSATGPPSPDRRSGRESASAVRSPAAASVAERRDLMVATYSLLCATGASVTAAVCTGSPCIPAPAPAVRRLLLAAGGRQPHQNKQPVT